MPRYLKTIIICVLFWVCAVPALSELYQYTDQNGITRLTDNIYSVPAGNRSQLEQYSEIPGVSDEMEIQPLEKKAPPQAKTEKIILPKIDKPIPAVAGKDIVVPDAVQTEAVQTEAVQTEAVQTEAVQTEAVQAEAVQAELIPAIAEKKTVPDLKEKIPVSVQPAVSEKTVHEPDAGLSTRKIHKSPAITIDKKAPPEIPPPAKPIENIVEMIPQSNAPQKPEIKPEVKPEPKTAKLQTDINTSNPVAPEPKTKVSPKPVIPDQKTPVAVPQALPASETAPRKILPEVREKSTAAVKKQNANQTDNAEQKPLAGNEKQTPGNLQLPPDTSGAKEISIQAEHAAETVPPPEVMATDNAAPDEDAENLVLARLETTRKALADKKEALNKKFLGLMKEKEKIENSVDENDEQSVLKYNENVKRLNNKIKRYKIEKKHLQAEIEKYNDSIRQANLN